jgi:transposase
MRTKVSDKTFEGQSFYVGIDYHKKSWKVTVLGQEYEHKTMSRDPDPEQLVAYLERQFPGAAYKAVYEAGFSGFNSCRRLRELGVDCQVIHPADVPTNQKDRLQKTDKADSRKLAKMLRAGEFAAVHVPDPQTEADLGLLRQRFKIMKDLVRQKNRVKSALFQFGVKIPERFSESDSRHWSNAYMKWLSDISGAPAGVKHIIRNYLQIGRLLKQELSLVTKQVRELSRTDRYTADYELLVGIPGIGPLGAMMILTQLGGMKRFKRMDELCNYVGLVPNMYCSGEKMITGKVTSRGRKELKIMLIEASWVAIRKDPALMARFNELCKRMQKNKAIIRIAKNLLARIRYVLNKKESYVTGVVS